MLSPKVGVRNHNRSWCTFSLISIQISMDGLPPGAPLFILGNPQYGNAAAIAPSNYAQEMHGMHMHEVVQVRH